MVVGIRHLFISPGHNFFGHYGKPAGENPTTEVAEIMCRAGHGVEGDRFFDYKQNYAGQITFFSWDIYRAVREKFGVPTLSAGAFRRNVIIEGVDINNLIGRNFSLGGVDFEGTVESKPCYWMNQAVAPGVEEWLRGNGGLRAKILSDGPLKCGTATLSLAAATLSQS
jgi:MOSC domain-containing protein YiiM